MRFLGVVLFSLLSLQLQVSLVKGGNAYLVKQREVDDVTEALSILRRFIPPQENFDEKCQRYAVLLKQMAHQPSDQFAIAELGLVKMNAINGKYKEIDVESLRQLYMDAISKSLEGEMDLSTIELIDCLVRKFRSHDAKARAFLNSPGIAETVEQYKSIMSQPLAFSTDPSASHPSLSAEQLTPTIRRLMLDVYNGDHNRLASKFPVAEQHPPVVFASSEPAAAATAAAGTTMPPVNQAQPAQEQFSLSDDEAAYLSKLSESLRSLYATLPIESSLPVRCQAYAKLVDADPNAVDEDLLEAVIRESSQQASKLSKGQFVPEAETRENFLVALDSFQAEQRDSAWLDLLDCVSEWESLDENVSHFLNHPEMVKVIDEMLRAQESS